MSFSFKDQEVVNFNFPDLWGYLLKAGRVRGYKIRFFLFRFAVIAIYCVAWL